MKADKILMAILIVICSALVSVTMYQSALLISKSNEQEVQTESGETIVVDKDRYIYFQKSDGYPIIFRFDTEEEVLYEAKKNYDTEDHIWVPVFEINGVVSIDELEEWTEKNNELMKEKIYSETGN